MDVTMPEAPVVLRRGFHDGRMYVGSTFKMLEKYKKDGLRVKCPREVLHTTKRSATKDEMCEVLKVIGAASLTKDPQTAMFFSQLVTQASRKGMSGSLLVTEDLEDMVVVEVETDRLDPFKLSPHAYPAEEEGDGLRYNLEYDYPKKIRPDLLHFYRWDIEARDFVLLH